MSGSGGTVRRVLVALGAVVAWFAVPLAGAAAQSIGQDPFDCDAAVVDQADVLDAEALVAQIEGVAGARVVVRSFQSVPGGDLPTTINDVIADCFTGDSTEIDPTLAVFGLSIDDRTTDVFLGSSLPGGSVPDELADMMADEFPDDFTGGVSVAIARLDELLGGGAGDGADGSDGSDGEGVTGSADDSSTTDGPGAGDESDGGGVSGGVLLGSAAVVAAGAGGVLLVRRRRTLIAARNELASALTGPRARVGAAREQAAALDARAELWGRIASGSTLLALNELRNRTRSAATETERSAAVLSQATPDGVSEASAEQIAKATERLAELRDALDRHEKGLDELFALGARLDHLRVALPAKKELLLGELEASERLTVERRNEGWLVDEPEGELVQVRTTLHATDLNEFALDLLELSERIEGAEARLFSADHELQSLPDRPGALEAWRTKQREAAELEYRRIVHAREALAAAGSVHGVESWQWAAEYPSQAEHYLREAERLGEEAMALSARQEFRAAGRDLERAGLQLIGADDLLDQVDDLMIDLEQAKLEAAGILAESRTVADQFGTYVEQHRGDLEARLVARPQLLDEMIDGLGVELRQPRPNYLRVAQTADRLNRELDDLLELAQEQHQRMEALRRQAEREVARAIRGIRRAKESLGWQLFPSREARQLEEIEKRLGSLPTEPAARVEAAQDLADAAVAIQERIIADRRRGGNWVIVGGGMGRGGAWGGSTSTSGTGGGRSFGGGGGGRSFGGGGGGRSFGGGRGTGSW